MSRRRPTVSIRRSAWDSLEDAPGRFTAAQHRAWEDVRAAKSNPLRAHHFAHVLHAACLLAAERAGRCNGTHRRVLNGLLLDLGIASVRARRRLIFGDKH